MSRMLQLEFVYVLDPGSTAAIQLYGVAFGVTASTIMFRIKKYEISFPDFRLDYIVHG